MKTLLIILFMLIQPVQGSTRSVDEILAEYKTEYADWKKEQKIKQKVNELVAPYPETNKQNQKEIAKQFLVNFDEKTAKVALEVSKNESGFRSDAYNFNSNASSDKGCWQINDVHNLPDKVRYNCKKATEWAVKKVKQNGGFGIWVAYNNIVKHLFDGKGGEAK